jgi:hypothetical protein
VLAATLLAALPTRPAAASGSATPVAAPAPFTSWDDFLDQQYLDLLGAQPTPSTRAAAHDALGSGTTEPGPFVASVRSSAEHQANVDPVARLYRAFFLRIPDRGGLVHWIAARRGGNTLGTIAEAFARSSEFTRRYGWMSNRDFVLLVYANVLQRTPDSGGVAFWTGQLDSERRTRGSVMAGFSESSEYRTKQASEVDAAVLPILLLGRAPTTAEFDATVGRLDAGGTVADEATTILPSAEYRRRAARQRVVVFGDSIPDSLINNGSAGTDLSTYDLVNGTVPACDGADHPPPARIRNGTIHFMSKECAKGWKAQYPPDLVFPADQVILASGVNAMLDHKLEGVWRHPCHTAARDWYHDDLVVRLTYLHTRSPRVVLVLPPWPGENSGWIMPADMVQRGDCVRAVMNRAAKETHTPVVDLGAKLCPDPRTCSQPYRTKDGIHVDVAKAPEILAWLLHATAVAAPDAPAPLDPLTSGLPALPPDAAPSSPTPLDPAAGSPPAGYRFTPAAPGDAPVAPVR